ncbi:MAG: hypothetical protein RQ750_12300, partial [Roseovarius sp.]|nr:hypothetical protein [Roseovarius sp.]
NTMTKARWRSFTTEAEERQIAEIDARNRDRAALVKADTIVRTRIMSRAIRRMRRREGKT